MINFSSCNNLENKLYASVKIRNIYPFALRQFIFHDTKWTFWFSLSALFVLVYYVLSLSFNIWANFNGGIKKINVTIMFGMPFSVLYLFRNTKKSKFLLIWTKNRTDIKIKVLHNHNFGMSFLILKILSKTKTCLCL